MPNQEVASSPRTLTPAEIKDLLKEGGSEDIFRAIDAKDADGNRIITTNPISSNREKILNSVAGACLFLAAAILLTSSVDATTGKTVSERFMDVFKNRGFGTAAAEGFHLGLLLMPIAAVGAAAFNSAAYYRNKDKISLDDAGEILLKRAKTLEGQSQVIGAVTQERIFEALAQVMQHADNGSKNPLQTMTKTLRELREGFLQTQIPNDTVRNLAAKFLANASRGEVMTTQQVREILQTSDSQELLNSALQSVDQSGNKVIVMQGNDSWNKVRSTVIAATVLPAALLLTNSAVAAVTPKGLIEYTYIATRIAGAPKAAFYPILASVVGVVGAAAASVAYMYNGDAISFDQAGEILAQRMQSDSRQQNVFTETLVELARNSSRDGFNPKESMTKTKSLLGEVEFSRFCQDAEVTMFTESNGGDVEQSPTSATLQEDQQTTTAVVELGLRVLNPLVVESKDGERPSSTANSASVVQLVSQREEPSIAL